MFFIYLLFSVILKIENQILKFPGKKLRENNLYLNIQNIKVRYLNKHTGMNYKPSINYVGISVITRQWNLNFNNR